MPTMKRVTLKILLTLMALAMMGSMTNARSGQPGEPVSPLQISAGPVPMRIACVGDSIVAGAFLPNPEFDSYPGQLFRMLGDQWEVNNFGVSGATLLNAGDKPYQMEKAFTNALKYNPNIVIIGLGGNDSKPQNWKFKELFVEDYKNLIKKFKALPS